MSRVFYRIGQFWQGLAATVAPAEMRRVAETLPAAAMPLFTQMPVDAQRHSLNVLASVQAAGYDHPDLAVAALLHDCGKVAAAQGGVRLGLWLRGPLVLMDAFAPKFAARWASPDPAQGWRYALYVQQKHAMIGAQWAAEAGCSALSCWLIAQHQTPPATIESSGDERDARYQLLTVLQAADEGN